MSSREGGAGSGGAGAGGEDCLAMDCRELVDFLMDYLDGRLPDATREVFEEHIGLCPPCQAYLETYRDTVRMGRCVCRDGESAPADAPEELVRAILAARRRGKASR
jgi:predicted anti-sigma-YlaC factor YlaD